MKKRFLSVLLCALLIALCVSAIPTASAAAEDQPDDLPDIDIHSWEYVLCNAYNSVGYHNSERGDIEGQGLDPRVVDYAVALLRAAREDGITIYIAASWRTLEWIDYTYQNVFKYCEYDPIAAAKTFQGIGVNEHQLGLAIDFTDLIWNRANYELFDDPEIFDSEMYAWLLEHAADYGFVLRYPEGKEYYYGVACPHAHFRYVGAEAARYMKAHDLCLEEFLMLYDPDLVFIPENGRFTD